MTVLCFGDSNTWGFDPRDFFGGRYEADARWCDLLAAETGCRVVNLGENGRTVPRRPAELRTLERALQKERPDVLILMLGSNDALQRRGPEETAAAMDALLIRVRQIAPQTKLLLAAPPPVGLPEPELQKTLQTLGARWRTLARKHGARFFDPGEWSLPLAFDGVHFSEGGKAGAASSGGRIKIKADDAAVIRLFFCLSGRIFSDRGP